MWWHWILSKSVFLNGFPCTEQLSRIVQSVANFINCPARRNDKTSTPRVMELLFPGSATVWTSSIHVTLDYVWDDLPTDICIPPLHPRVSACLNTLLLTSLQTLLILISPHPPLSALVLSTRLPEPACVNILPSCGEVALADGNSNTNINLHRNWFSDVWQQPEC